MQVEDHDLGEKLKLKQKNQKNQVLTDSLVEIHVSNFGFKSGNSWILKMKCYVTIGKTMLIKRGGKYVPQKHYSSTFCGFYMIRLQEAIKVFRGHGYVLSFARFIGQT